MLRVVLIRSGITDYDEQGRIIGRLSIPLNSQGIEQTNRAALEVAELDISQVFSAPSDSSTQTAQIIAKSLGLKVKQLPLLENLDPGLWQGKLIEEVKVQHPKNYRRWQEQPETMCPPQGEMLSGARERLTEFVEKVCRKVKDGVVAIVLPEPLASVLAAMLKQQDIGDLWQTEDLCGSWEVIEVNPISPVTP